MACYTWYLHFKILFNNYRQFLLSTVWIYKGADKSLARPGRKQANVSVRMAWISFGALPCRKKESWWQLASRCCWNRARPWYASQLVSFLVRLLSAPLPWRRGQLVDTNPPNYTASYRRRCVTTQNNCPVCTDEKVPWNIVLSSLKQSYWYRLL